MVHQVLQDGKTRQEHKGLWAACVVFFAVFVAGAASTSAIAQKYLPDASITGKKLAPARASAGSSVIPRLETPLSELYLGHARGAALSPRLTTQLGEYLDGGKVRVVLVAQAEESVPALREAVIALGGEINAAFETRLEITVPVAALKGLSETPGVLFVRRPLPVLPLESAVPAEVPAIGAAGTTGAYVTRGVVVSGADRWHARGITGRGVRVAILDDFKDYVTAQSRGELPPSITKYGTLDTSGSRHGTAVAEIIYDMAPGASLTFATPGSATQMASYIVALAQAGNRVISSSMGYYLDEPGDGTGSVSSSINTATNTYGALYCQAAGNQAQYHWDGNFYDSDGDGFHEFAPGVEVNQLGRLPKDYPIMLFMRWNDWPVSDQDYDLYLMYSDGGPWQVAALSENVQNGTQPPTESIQGYVPADGLWWGFAVYRYAAARVKTLDIMGHNAPSFQFNQPVRSLVDPATATRSFSVAAVDARTLIRKNYSSVGPTHGPGGSLTGGRAKPRIAGYADVDTWAYGPGVFNGTSAATPHVSGAAALVWQAFRNYSPLQVMQFLEARALDRGAVGYDLYHGAGALRLGDVPEIRHALPFLQLLLKK